MAYLRQRSAEQNGVFQVGSPSAAQIVVVFPFSKWLFNLALRLDWRDGRWTVQGSLELNPTRLVAWRLDRFTYPGIPAITAIDLLRGEGGMDGPPYPTLDGNDNVVPPHLVPRALGCDWPAFVRHVLGVIVQVVAENTGTAHDFSSADPRGVPVLRLPAPTHWVPKEVETYFEFEDESAVARVHEIAGRGSAIAASFSQDEYELTPIAGQVRAGNAVAARFGLGATGVELLIYAKARDRIRAEVRYKGNALKAAGITREHYEADPDAFWPSVLRHFAENAQRRVNRLSAAYNATLGIAGPRRHRLALLLAHVARICEGDARLTTDVLSLLLANRGFSLTGDGALDRAVLALARNDVVRPTRSSLRARRTEYAISPFYAQTLELLGRLEPLRS